MVAAVGALALAALSATVVAVLAVVGRLAPMDTSGSDFDGAPLFASLVRTNSNVATPTPAMSTTPAAIHSPR